MSPPEEIPESYQLDTRIMRRSFSQAAKKYDNFAVLQKEVSTRTLENLDGLVVAPDTVIDLGAGTGSNALVLKKRYKKSRVYPVDCALDMLVQAKQNQGVFSKLPPVCADARALPFGDSRIDLVFSNLMLQWLLPPDQAIREIHRVLTTNGLFLFSTFGPQTLLELRTAWAKVDEEVHVNAFTDMHDLGDALIRAGFQAPVMDAEFITLTYPDTKALLQDLRGIGVRNVNQGRRQAITGRRRWQAFLNALGEQAEANRIPLTYEIVYGHAWKPEPGERAQDGSTVAGSPIQFHPRR